MNSKVALKPGPKPNFDYKALWFEFCAMKSKSPITYDQFAQLKGVNNNTLSVYFSQIKREEEMRIIRERNPELITLAQGRIRDALVSGAGVKEDQIASFSLDAYKAVADREGLSPQASIINITNSANAQAAAVAVPIFATNTDEFKNLLGGE